MSGAAPEGPQGGVPQGGIPGGAVPPKGDQGSAGGASNGPDEIQEQGDADGSTLFPVNGILFGGPAQFPNYPTDWITAVGAGLTLSVGWPISGEDFSEFQTYPSNALLR
jgi:hypothetical protein